MEMSITFKEENIKILSDGRWFLLGYLPIGLRVCLRCERQRVSASLPATICSHEDHRRSQSHNLKTYDKVGPTGVLRPVLHRWAESANTVTVISDYGYYCTVSVIIELSLLSLPLGFRESSTAFCLVLSHDKGVMRGLVPTKWSQTPAYLSQ